MRLWFFWFDDIFSDWWWKVILTRMVFARCKTVPCSNLIATKFWTTGFRKWPTLGAHLPNSRKSVQSVLTDREILMSLYALVKYFTIFQQKDIWLKRLIFRPTFPKLSKIKDSVQWKRNFQTITTWMLCIKSDAFYGVIWYCLKVRNFSVKGCPWEKYFYLNS